MSATEEAPINVCLVCGGELERARKRKGWICKECGFYWPDEMFDAEVRCIDKPETMK